MVIPPVPRETVLSALKEFDSALRQLPEWQGWQENGNYEWKIVHEGHEYPPKQIIRMATRATTFSGGPEANGYLRRRGFEIRPIRDWDIQVGQQIARKAVHDRYGGGRQGGIEPSASTPNVLIFSDPKAGEKYGYNFDGWKRGIYHYTGDGQVGEQRFIDGNKAIRDHDKDERALRLFDGVRGTVTYIGQFELDSDPYYFATAPDRNGETRQVIVFTLRPMGAAQPSPPKSRPPSVTDVPIEAHNADRFTVVGSEEQREAERREQPLVLAYQQYLIAKGHAVSRKRFDIPDEQPLFCDLFNQTRNQLIEAKGLGTRSEVRMAIGQLMDYRRWVAPPPGLAVLLAKRPTKDLESLINSAGAWCIWRTDSGFEDNANGMFV